MKRQLGNDFAGDGFDQYRGIRPRKSNHIEEGVQFARLAAEAGADAIQVRAHGYGHRGGLLQPDRLFYPEMPKPLARKTSIGSHKGVGADHSPRHRGEKSKYPSR